MWGVDGRANPRGVHGDHCRDPPTSNGELDIITFFN